MSEDSNIKGILRFNLNDPDASSAFRRAVNADNAYFALWDFSQYLRGLLKHPPETWSQETFDIVSKIREQFYDEINDRNIDLDDL